LTVEEILTLAGLHVDETIGFSDGGREWVNEALVMLGKDANLFGTNTITAEAKTFYNVSNTYTVLDVVEVEDSDGDLYLGYDVRGGQIRFADADTYKVTFRRLATSVTAQTDTPEVHSAFHPAIALFVASRFKSRNDDENPDAARLMDEFDAEVRKVAATLRRQARRPGTVAVYRAAIPG
jgi:hypothetical protein